MCVRKVYLTTVLFMFADYEFTSCKYRSRTLLTSSLCYGCITFGSNMFRLGALVAYVFSISDTVTVSSNSTVVIRRLTEIC